MIKEFKGKYFFLSNFFLDGLDGGITLEHRFQAQKTFNQSWRHHILEAETPGEAKRRGRSLPRSAFRQDWEVVKVSIMLRLLLEKFENEKLRERLVATYPHFLQEGNTWNDSFWGVPLDTGIGRNILGKLLMLIRDIHMSKSRLDFPGDLPFV